MSARHRVFVSATTADLGSYRTEVANELRRFDIDAVVQDAFPLTMQEADAKLRGLIGSCDAVIFLVGFRYGGAPTGQDVWPPKSYTQLEYDFAVETGKPHAMLIADEKFIPPVGGLHAEDEELEGFQKVYRGRLKRSGHDWASFSNLDQLLRLVTQLDFVRNQPPAAKPNNLPLPSIGSLFKGREDLLDELRARLTGGGAAALTQPQALCGLGGVGKTRAAIEYAWRFEKEYQALLFVSADSAAGLTTNLAGLTAVLPVNRKDVEEQPEQARLEAVLDWLAAKSDWLLILDNVDSDEAATAVASLLGPLARGRGHVLITSRRTVQPVGVKSIELDVLGEEAAVAFLLERTDEWRVKTVADEADAREIARELDRFTLALEQAGAGVNARRYSLAKYREVWAAEAEKVLAWHDPVATGYPVSVAVTWQVTVDNLTADVRSLLEVLSFLAPDPIPRSLFESDEAREVLAEAGIADADTALSELLRFSLASADRAAGGSLRVHRLVQKVARDGVRKEERKDRTEAALRLVDAAFAGNPADARNWRALDPLAPHAAVITFLADADGIAKPTLRLMNALGILHSVKAAYATSEPLLRRALAISESTLGQDNRHVAVTLNNLANLLQSTGRHAEAEPLYRRAAAIDEAVYGPDHQDVAVRLNNLANLLHATGRHAEAESLYRRAAAIDEAVYGPDHQEVAIDLSNLSNVLQATGRHAEAEPLLRRALAISEAAYDPEHPLVGVILGNLARLLRETGRQTEAEPLFRRAVAISEASLGPDHPDVADRLNNLAYLLQDTGRHAEAEPLFRRAVAIGEATLGPEHPHVATQLKNLAGLLWETGRHDEAESMNERASAILRRFEEANGHPYTG